MSWGSGERRSVVNRKFRIIFLTLMVSAMFFGFLHLFLEGGHGWNFERLHIFLFNLCTGGTMIIHYTVEPRRSPAVPALFLVMGIFYTAFAWLEIYLPAVAVSLAMALLVEWVRWRAFSPFPWNFFRSGTAVSEKFHHASLLCLSLGLIISSLVILNNEFLGIIRLRKLILNTFFLGFSFPVSLITMSVMFTFIRREVRTGIGTLENASFWIINLGVIIFFLFILMETTVPQLLVTGLLFVTVIAIYTVFRKYGRETQQKVFLTSGMAFLVFTAISGITYIFIQYAADYGAEISGLPLSKLLLKVHAFASLYGWNLSGLAVISRKDNFPIELNMASIIILHWVTVLVLAPLGYYFRPFAVMALAGYAFLVYHIFFSRGNRKQNN